MTRTPTKTISARIDQAVHAKVQAALRTGENHSAFLAAAIERELEFRRVPARRAATLDQVAEMSASSLDTATMSQALLRVIDSKLTRLLAEMDIQP